MKEPKQTEKKEYYDITVNLERFPDFQYYIIWGGRGSGKSYSVMKYLADDFFNNGHTFVISKRYQLDLKVTVCSTMFDPLADYIAETYGMKMKFYHGRWFAYDMESEGKMADCTVMGYALAVNESDRVKGLQISDKCRNILFEEFMSQQVTSYLDDEVNLLVNNVSTVFRHCTDGKVFLLGNAISKTNPYATALGIQFHRMEKGEIKQATYTDKKRPKFKTKFLIERTDDVNVYEVDNDSGVVYDIFGDKANSMIRDGEFETATYNRHYNYITFDECIKGLKKVGYDVSQFKRIRKEHRLPIAIQFEDYFFVSYRVRVESHYCYAFREVHKKHITPKSVSHLFNASDKLPGIDCVKNLAYYRGNAEIERLLDDMIHAIRQGRFIAMSDDAGEDVMNGFKQAGINL